MPMYNKAEITDFHAMRFKTEAQFYRRRTAPKW